MDHMNVIKITSNTSVSPNHKDLTFTFELVTHSHNIFSENFSYIDGIIAQKQENVKHASRNSITWRQHYHQNVLLPGLFLGILLQKMINVEMFPRYLVHTQLTDLYHIMPPIILLLHNVFTPSQYLPLNTVPFPSHTLHLSSSPLFCTTHSTLTILFDQSVFIHLLDMSTQSHFTPKAHSSTLIIPHISVCIIIVFHSFYTYSHLYDDNHHWPNTSEIFFTYYQCFTVIYW